MTRVATAALCLMLWAVAAQAGGLDDFKAANAAAEQGKSEEAIRLFTSALDAGDLPAADQLTAHRLRGREYIARSLVADAFQRLDQASSLRMKAIEDFTAAIAGMADDASLFVARGEAKHLNGQYAAAVADFDAALKLKTTTVTLVQRGAAKRANADYDGAVADYTAALASDANEKGDSAPEILNERGFAQFLAARFDAAAADFAKALEAGGSAHTGDVLWLPYQAAWLHIARARAGQNDAEELARNAGKIDLKQWPGSLIAYFLGKTTLADIEQPSGHGAMGHGRACNLATFSGELALAKKDSAEAARQFQTARAVCNIHTMQYLAAGVEMKRLAK